MDNATMARLLEETADLLEIDGGDSFRIRSYRRAAEAAEQTTVDLWPPRRTLPSCLRSPASAKAWPPICRPLSPRARCRCATNCWPATARGLLELLKLPGMGPKTVALLVGCGQDRQHRRTGRGHRRRPPEGLPRMGAKQIEKLRKGIDDYRRSAGRFRIDVAEEEAKRISGLSAEISRESSG